MAALQTSPATVLRRGDRSGRAPRDGPIVEEFGTDADTYWTLFESQALLKTTWQDFAQVHNWGIGGFPTVIYRDGDRGHVVARGYTGAEAMLRSLEQVAPVVGEMCGPDEVC